MSDTRADQVIKRQGQLEGGRANFDSLFQQVGERVLPGEANFSGTTAPGTDRTSKQFDSTAPLALKKYAAILESLGMPRTAEYHSLKPAEESIEDNWEVKTYFEAVNKMLFRWRYAPRANFTGAIGSLNLNLGAFGNGPLFVDEIPGYGIRYRAIPLSEAYLAENHAGVIDTVYRKFQYSARQAVKLWKDKCPTQIKTAYAKEPDQLFTFIHAVQPVDEAEGKRYPKGAQYTSCWVSADYRALMQEGHYFTFPYPTGRDVTMAGEVYARGPAVWVLAGIKGLNEMKRTMLRMGQKSVEPPLMTTEDGALAGFNMRSGAMNPGTLDAQGNELVKPFNSGSRLDIGEELLEIEQRTINESFYVTLLQVVVDHPQMTATEALQRAQEQGMLLGPVIGRQQEFLGQQVERELDIHARAGRLPEMPDILIEAGGEYKIEYDSPLTRIQKSGEGLAITRTFEVLLPVAELRPDVLDNFNLDDTAKAFATVNGMPTKLQNAPEVVEKIRADRAQQMAAAAAIEAAPQVAKAAKDVGLAA